MKNIIYYCFLYSLNLEEVFSVMAAYRNFSDNELAVLLREGDQAAFAEIYERYYGVLFIYALKLLKDEHEAEDTIHELFLALWTKAPVLNFPTPLANYLYRSVKNRAFDALSHRKIKTGHLESLQRYIDAGHHQTEEAVLAAELAREIEKEVARLPAKMREVFELSRKANLSHKEIASELGISDKTVKKQIGNAIKTLRVKFNSLLFSILF
jgi:RNA polymerase sigma-70 factor (ECF subfamily)